MPTDVDKDRPRTRRGVPGPQAGGLHKGESKLNDANRLLAKVPDGIDISHRRVSPACTEAERYLKTKGMELAEPTL